MFGLAITLVAFSLMQSASEWPRQVEAGMKVHRVDHPPPHPLAWFQQHPVFREEGEDLCWNCSREERIAKSREIHASTKLELVGQASGFEIFDLFTAFEQPGFARWKSVLIKVGQDLYREIHHMEPPTGVSRIGPTFVVKLGQSHLIGTRVYDGGNLGLFSEQHFILDRDGPHVTSFRAVEDAAWTTVPPGKILYTGGPGNRADAISRGEFTYFVKNNEDARCCSKGLVIVKFRVERTEVRITSASFNPDCSPF